MKISNKQFYTLLTWVVFLYALVFAGNIKEYLAAGDPAFLYHRAEGLFQSIKDCNFGIFDYASINGVGYGDTFFYGGLTLVPFLLIVPLGLRNFVTTYFFAGVVMHAYGVYTLTKRVKGCDSKLFVLLYLSNICVMTCFLFTVIMCSNFAVGLGYFYIAFLIDFFRDKKSCAKASLLFFLVFETHTLTAMMLFAITFILFVLYFNKLRIKDYIVFGVQCVLFCSYRICNILYHSDTLSLCDFVVEQSLKKNTCYFGTEGLYFGGKLAQLIYHQLTNKKIIGYTYMDLVMLTLIVISIIKNRKKISKRCIALLVICSIGIVISQPNIWGKLNPVIQFPIRYSPYLILTLYLIGLRWLSNKRLLRILLFFEIIVSSASIILGGKMSETFQSDYDWICDYVGAGEYLTFSILDVDLAKLKEMSKQCIDLKTGHEYNYGFEKEKMIVNVDYSEGNTRLRVPKLWYKGYICYNKDTGKKYKCESGLYQFIEIDLGNDTGKFIIKYTHPWWLWGIMFLSYLSVVAICVFYLRNRWLKRPLIRGNI